jgi:hypothetical protein
VLNFFIDIPDEVFPVNGDVEWIYYAKLSPFTGCALFSHQVCKVTCPKYPVNGDV